MICSVNCPYDGSTRLIIESIRCLLSFWQSVIVNINKVIAREMDTMDKNREKLEGLIGLIQLHIERTYHEINKLGYELYGLKEDEIKIVEQK